MALDVTSEFISENQKRGGPYNKNDRAKRQAEVYRLHVELSYSAPKIAEMMKINIKTVYKDIKAINKRLGIEWRHLGADAVFMKQVNRLEQQRQRLVERLESAKTHSDVMAVEKILYDLDWKIISLVTKIEFNDETIVKRSIADMNRWAKETGAEVTWINKREAFCCLPDTAKKIEKLLAEDEKARGFK